MNADNDFSRAGDVLKNLFDRLLPEGTRKYANFFSGWDTLAGPDLAPHLRPRDIVNHVLILDTDHPGWSQRFRMDQERILNSLWKKYPELEIRRIRVVVGNGNKREAAVERHAERVDSGGPAVTGAGDSPLPVEDGDQAFLNLLEKMRRHADS